MPRVRDVRCEPGKSRSYFRDEQCPHLWLAVTDNGAKTFFVYKRVRGKPQRTKIGRFPEVTVEKARKRADEIFGDILKGIDPNAAKRELRHGLTLQQLFDDYIEAYAKPRKRTWEDDQEQFRRYLTGWENRKIAEIQKHHVAALHAKLGQDSGPYAANRVLALLHGLFSWADRDRGWKGGNPAHGLKKFPEDRRERFLTEDELPRFFKALDQEPSTDFQDFFRLCLFTGARRGNVQSMRWPDLDLRDATWTVPSAAFKTKKTHTIVLIPEAVEILKARKEHVEHPEWVFPSRGKSGHLEEPKLAWKRLLLRAKITDLRLHDLRRTLGSWMAAGGASLPIIGKTLGHTRPETTAIYARVQLFPVRQAVNAAAQTILAAGKGKDSAK